MKETRLHFFARSTQLSTHALLVAIVEHEKALRTRHVPRHDPAACGQRHRAQGLPRRECKECTAKNALHANAYYLKIFQDIPMEDCSGWPQSGPRVAKERAQDDPRIAQAVWPQDDPRMTKGRPKDCHMGTGRAPTRCVTPLWGTPLIWHSFRTCVLPRITE